MNNHHVAFWTPNNCLQKDRISFGCSTHGFADNQQWVNPNDNQTNYWDEELRGSVLAGKYSEVLVSLSELQYKPKVCIAFFSKNVGIELFINRYQQVMSNIPLIGGLSANGDAQERGELIPFGEDICLLAISDGCFELQSVNIYKKTELAVEIKKRSDRDIDLLRVLPNGKWQNAIDFYRTYQRNLDIDSSNFESITFCDKDDRNLHFSAKGKTLHSGADLPNDNKMFLCIENKIDEKLKDFMSSKRSLIFACAGIRSRIHRPIYTGKNSLAGFMFGEIVILNHKPMFGNLMLAKITVK
jgi:hypothetical protein